MSVAENRGCLGVTGMPGLYFSDAVCSFSSVSIKPLSQSNTTLKVGEERVVLLYLINICISRLLRT